MYTEGKSGQIYHQLKTDIASGLLAPGDRLPCENTLAARFHVARKTLRRAMAMLEQDALIERKRRLGTFIRAPGAPASQFISLLTACPNYFRTVERGYAAQIIFEGLLAATFRCNCRVETIAVSPTNDMTDIDFAQLEHLNAQSMVICESSWYIPLFNFLQKRHCRVLSINRRNFRRTGRYLETTLLPDDWFTLTLDLVSAVRDGVNFLAGAGAGKIALAACFLDVENHAIWDGYRAGLHDSGRAEIPALFLSNARTESSLDKQLRAFYERGKFDGLVLYAGGADCNGKTVFTPEGLGLPKDFPIVVVDSMPAAAYNAPQLPTIAFDFAELGKMAAEMLLAPDGGARERIVKAQWRHSALSHGKVEA